MSEGSGRPTIGLIFPDVVDFGAMCWGAFDAAAEQGANAICFQGSPLKSPIGFSAQANRLYDLIDRRTLDGLVIWTGWLGQFVGAAEAVRFCEQFAPLPVVSISQQIDGIPCVLGDNYQSMRDIMAHLVEVHHCRRLALITGPRSNLESAERYQAYRDLQARYGMAFDPALVISAQFTYDAGVEAVRQLIDQRRTAFDAVITGDDFVALGVIEGLQARGLRVPEDVAVVGFDDAPHAQATIPPLTTVRQSAYDQGFQGVRLLLARLHGEPYPAQVSLPMRLIIRQSCGCSNPAVLRAMAAGPSSEDQAAGSSLASDRDRIAGQILASLGDVTERVEAHHVTRLLDAFVQEIEAGSAGVFIPALEAILTELIDRRANVFVCQDVLSAMRRVILPLLDERASLIRATNLWGQARVLVGEMALRIQAQRHLKVALQTRLLREIGQEFITTFDLDDLLDLLVQEIPKIGIAGCWLVRYGATANDQPETAYLLAGFDGSQVLDGSASGQRFPAHELAVRWLARDDRPFQVIVEPLYFRERQLGFVIFEPGPRDGTIYEALRGYLTTALHGALLFQHNLDLYREADQARADAEKADQLKTLLLANVSHDLRTPLNVIQGYAETALNNPRQYGITLPDNLREDLQQIRSSADYLTRIINDLLDLSRAEINELDLYSEIVDPRPLLVRVFENMAESRADGSTRLDWQLSLPDQLPLIQADPDRLRQVLFNLLSNAWNYTTEGRIVLGADVQPPYLHIWVQDTGAGIPAEDQERIFGAFETRESARGRQQGIGLGLSISRQLVALHRGFMSLESAPGQGSTFHVYLPLPSLSGEQVPLADTGCAAMLLLSSDGAASPTALALAERQGWMTAEAATEADLGALLADDDCHYVAIAWDLGAAAPGDWTLIQRIQAHPQLCRLPLLLFGVDPQAASPGQGDAAPVTQVMLKPLSGEALLQAITGLLPRQMSTHVLAVDDDPQALRLYRTLIQRALPACTITLADSGEKAVRHLRQGPPPSLIILDLMMPGMDGFEVLERLRAQPRTRAVPVLVLSGKLLTQADIERLSQQGVLLHSKHILTDNELERILRGLVSDGPALEGQASTLVKRALAYIHQHYTHPIARSDICQVLGISENYLSRLFRQELGLTLVEYINRYRIQIARDLLEHTDLLITVIAQQVGFDDPAYFSRVFAQQVGMSPRAYRRAHDAASDSAN